MKKSVHSIFSSFSLFAFLILIPFILSACAGGEFGFDPALVARSKIVLSANFESPTGWVTSSGNNIQISIDSSALDSLATIQCRSGVKAKIANVPFTTCPTTVSPVVDATQNSGTYTTEVKAVVAGATIDSTFMDYYVHPSLSSLAACPDLKTDAQYMALAGAYLNQSSVFGNTTSLKAPFTQVKFSDKMTYPLTLRKKFVMNDARTLLLLKRRFVSQVGNCVMRAKALTARGRTFANKTAATLADINAEELNVQRSYAQVALAVGSGMVSIGGFTRSAGTSQDTSGPRWEWFLRRTNKAPNNGFSTIHTYTLSGSAQCDAIVLNAKGDAICFENGSTRFYRTVEMKDQFNFERNKNVPNDTGNRNTFSSKWRKKEAAGFNAFKANNATHDNFVTTLNGTDIEFYLLED